tara:strand:- start:2452 stop:2634 length:183 start_codon:yes stop_codon:yes gene_type:complete
MKGWQIISVIFIILIILSLYIVAPEKSTFSVISQRNESGKSSAVKEKWDGKGSIIDMIWR